MQAGIWVKRRFRLTRATDFERVRRNGKSYAHPFIVLLVSGNASPEIHIGILASRSLGGAVIRNRSKRRMRAIVNEILPNIQPGYNMVFILRPPLVQASFEELRNATHQVLRRAGVLLETNGS